MPSPAVFDEGAAQQSQPGFAESMLYATAFATPIIQPPPDIDSVSLGY
jgi:hypothetical protein